MTITGLDSDYYCVHNPLPVTVTAAVPESISRLRLSFAPDGVDSGLYYPIIYNIDRVGSDNVFRVDIGAWVRQFLSNFEEQHTYTTTPTTYQQDNVRSIDVIFETLDSDGDTIETETVTRKFVNCALDSYSLADDDDPFCCVKVWQCYPFSSPFDGWDSRVMLIPMDGGNICSVIPFICEKLDYDNSCCRGAYIKWLNDKGYYSYWLFPDFKTIVREAKEVDRKPRSVFDPSRTSNEDTLGFDATETVEVRDRIVKPYWDTIKTLIGSPEVYLLRPSWEPGTDTEAKPEDWIKVIQAKPKFERDTRNNTAEFEIEFDLPKVYTQRRCY